MHGSSRIWRAQAEFQEKPRRPRSVMLMEALFQSHVATGQSETVAKLRFRWSRDSRAEGPAVSSHARQGVVCVSDDMEVRRTGTKPVSQCQAFGPRTTGLAFPRPYGRGYALSALRAWRSLLRRPQPYRRGQRTNPELFSTRSDDPRHRPNFSHLLTASARKRTIRPCFCIRYVIKPGAIFSREVYQWSDSW
jgi:hypothetical protein